MKDDDGRMGSAAIAIWVCRVYSHGRSLVSGGFLAFSFFYWFREVTYIQLIEIFFTFFSHFPFLT